MKEGQWMTTGGWCTVQYCSWRSCTRAHADMVCASIHLSIYPSIHPSSLVESRPVQCGVCVCATVPKHDRGTNEALSRCAAWKMPWEFDDIWPSYNKRAGALLAMLPLASNCSRSHQRAISFEWHRLENSWCLRVVPALLLCRHDPVQQLPTRQGCHEAASAANGRPGCT